jgi:hypothetical protein
MQPRHIALSPFNPTQRPILAFPILGYLEPSTFPLSGYYYPSLFFYPGTISLLIIPLPGHYCPSHYFLTQALLLFSLFPLSGYNYPSTIPIIRAYCSFTPSYPGILVLIIPIRVLFPPSFLYLGTIALH